MTDSSPSAFRPSPSAFRPSPLLTDLRNKLERVVIDARDAAEVGARAALEALAVHHHEPYPHMKPRDRELRNHLRARARQLGDRQDGSGRLAIGHLVGECAYEHWHRMLFARFLAENNLLIEPESGVAISLEEAEELAREEGGRRKAEGGKVDVWEYVSRCAQRMLPQIFRPDDPLLQVSFATEHRIKLEELLASLPAEVFTASDALGWVYQFWQSKKKDEVNRSEVKIGADELPAVTQLFTEPYMVEFLLHNTLGAWWAGKRLKEQGERIKAEWEACQTEEDCRRLLAVPGVTWDYLRFVRKDEGERRKAKEEPDSSPSPSALHLSPFVPAAGTFDGWPKAAKDIKVLDPCCGSGHFLVAALHHLVPIRMAEEGLSAAKAVDAVLRDNLHGLEIDERCCQITAFALALAAWTYPDAGGYRELPTLSLAHTGASVGGTREQWMKILEGHGNLELRFFFGQLYDLFRKATTLGSLINPHRFLGSGMLNKKGMDTLLRHLQTAIVEDPNATPEKHQLGIAAQGLARAAELLAGRYTLVITNVPYLGRGKQDDILKEHLETQYLLGKADLATAFVLRCLEFCTQGGSTALVTPQNWLFLTTYKKLRELLLDNREWNIVARLGPGAFETIGGHVVNVALLVLSASRPVEATTMTGIDVSTFVDPQRIRAAEKAGMLRGDMRAAIAIIAQSDQLGSPDFRIVFERQLGHLVSLYAGAYVGLQNNDTPKNVAFFWEVDRFKGHWDFLQLTPDVTDLITGRHGIVRWPPEPEYLIKGREAWGKDGVLIRGLGLTATLYHGNLYDQASSALIPSDQAWVTAFWCFCSSPDLAECVRRIDQKMNVTNATFGKIPFDLAHWQKVAAEKYPNGLPEPESDDPTQWLFHGRPDEAQEGMQLQVAVARLLGYRWPAEHEVSGMALAAGADAEGGEKTAASAVPLTGADSDLAPAPMRLSQRARELVRRCEELLPFADNDGIVCIPAVRGEEPAAERLRRLLAAAFGERWSAELEHRQIRETGSTAADLDDWLRNDFFAQHCKLFLDRPFIWHIWDGRKRDGFHALVNYHRLAEKAEGERRKAEGHSGRRLLESLTYAYLGDWITRQKDGARRGEGGAEDRLAAALELQKRLEAILAGEPPFDIFVRWKPLSEQPIGWEPDINDGVRMNIRPFLASDLPGGKKGAGILRCKPNIKWTKDRGKEPERPKEEYPWFWGWDEKTVDFAGGKTFDGNRWNACHYTNKAKQSARDAAGKGKR